MRRQREADFFPLAREMAARSTKGCSDQAAIERR
jgi:hypothetical protein